MDKAAVLFFSSIRDFLLRKPRVSELRDHTDIGGQALGLDYGSMARFTNPLELKEYPQVILMRQRKVTENATTVEP